jgi:hypothetical protein
MSHNCSHRHESDEVILRALRDALKNYPEIIPYLKGEARKLAEDSPEWHQKFEPYNGDDHAEFNEGDWEITEEDIDRAIKRWNDTMKGYEGMLEAEVEVDEDAE